MKSVYRKFSVFNYMQSILGEAPQGKWKHIGLAKIFSKECYEKGILKELWRL
ncbi:MAG: hypothetical protein GXO21_02585 [Aquificae bacterium]|nr:hypothetical protein [Aquificota bacterium]